MRRSPVTRRVAAGHTHWPPAGRRACSGVRDLMHVVTHTGLPIISCSRALTSYSCLRK
jgi:hypothetical protein